MIAAKEIIENFGDYNSLFFDYITNKEIGYCLAKEARKHFVSLLPGFSEKVISGSAEGYKFFAEQAVAHCLFLEALGHYFHKMLDDRKKELINCLYAEFGGIRYELMRSYSRYIYASVHTDEPMKQLMVFITGTCNLQCPYCFSKAMPQREMPLDTFEEILQWAAVNQFKRITLCGGEPTIHSRFNEILSLIDKYDFTTYFASNLSVDISSFGHFNRQIIETIYVHITDAVLMDNIAFSKQQQIELVGRANIASKDTEIKKWFDFLQETGIMTLNVALTFPSADTENQYVDINSFAEYEDVIKELVNTAMAKHIRLSFAKPIPLCLFDRQMQHSLLANPDFHPLCNTHYHNYTHNVCIYPDMTIQPCLGISENKLVFNKELSMSKIEHFCADTIKPLLHKPLFPRCRDCFLYDRNLCQGSCLSYKIRS